MKRPKMNAYERFLYQKDTTIGHWQYCRIQFAKLFRDIGVYRFQMKLKTFIKAYLGIEVMFKSELPAKPLMPSERAVLRVRNGEDIFRGQQLIRRETDKG